jgi:hypothetical protein
MSKQRPKIREENKMSEKEINEMAEQLPPPPTEIPIEFMEGKKRTRKAQPLKWYERQYGAGFVSGFWVGIAVGFPLAAGVAAVCKVFVTWLFTFS